ncbi:hypothetical protein ACOSP7_032840 [Xanthoceras sorbifolium]
MWLDQLISNVLTGFLEAHVLYALCMQMRNWLPCKKCATFVLNICGLWDAILLSHKAYEPMYSLLSEI